MPPKRSPGVANTDPRSTTRWWCLVRSGSLRIWLGTGGNPESSVRAGRLGLPITYAIIGGEAARFAPLADLYRRAAQHVQAPADNVMVSIASPGFVSEESRAAKDLWYGHWHAIMSTVGATRG